MHRTTHSSVVEYGTYSCDSVCTPTTLVQTTAMAMACHAAYGHGMKTVKSEVMILKTFY